MSSNKENKIGTDYIKEFLETVPSKSGVYRMYDINKKCLYVGKAVDLKKRIKNYTSLEKNSLRIRQMINETVTMKIIVTNTEVDALLLEADLIKNINPKYNILLRDDKTFPYLRINLEHDFPSVCKFRTKNPKEDNLFGPFISGLVLKDTLTLMQKVFLLRVCSDSSFKNRTRPCVFYQIKRCSAPCVNYISKENYNKSIKEATDFLNGNRSNLKDFFAEKMNEASKNNDFESAITYREKIKTLNQINYNYNVILPENIDADFIAVQKLNSLVCINLFIFKNGHSHGNFTFFPHNADSEDLSLTLNSFLTQYYTNHTISKNIFCNILPLEADLLIKAFSQVKGSKVNIRLAPKNLLSSMKLVEDNTMLALSNIEKEKSTWLNNFNELGKILNMEDKILNIEVYDNSNFSGSNMIGIKISANSSGFNKKEYKIFKPSPNLNAHDDYGVMREVLTRRLSKISEDPDLFPSLLIIDGGKGQLNVALEVLAALKLKDKIRVICVTKGEGRKIGLEKLMLEDYSLIDLDSSSKLFNFILSLRDEAHRFAITTQRKLSLKKVTSSFLDNIEGIGKKRKTILLNHFGSLEDIKKSTLEDLEKVPYLSKVLAKKIYNLFH